MNSIKRHILNFIILISFFQFSCSDFLHQEPDSQISIDEQFATKDGLLQAVNGMYYTLEELMNGNVFVYSDLLGGNITFAPNSSSKLEIPSSIEKVFCFDDQADVTVYKSFYKNAYYLINFTNMIIEHLNDAPDVLDIERQQIKAEAIATRAYVHSLLTSLYAQNMNYTIDGSHNGIVYNTRVLDIGKDYPSRETKMKTYQYIKADLYQALSLYTGEPILDYGLETSYFNPINTRALLARIALDHGDWTTAYTAADSTISITNTQLVSKEAYIDAWKSEETMPEVLFELTTREDTAGIKTGSIGGKYFYYYYSPIPNSDNKTLTFKSQAFVASQNLREYYDNKDIRNNLYTPITLPAKVNGVYVDSTFYFIEKLQNNPGVAVIRLSELYLIRSEAQFMLDNSKLDLALNDLNVIRQRAGLQALSNLNTDEYIIELYNERRRELAFEGHVFFDHMRLKKDIIRGNDTYGAPQRLNYPNNKFILPIPQSTLDVNEFLEQNEGYY